MWHKKRLKKYINVFLKSDYLILLFVGLIFISPLAQLTSFRIFSARTILSVLYTFPELGLFALGTMLVMITAGIDLSLVGIVNLSAVLTGLLLKKLALDGSVAFIMAIIIIIFVSTLCGLLNASLIALLNVHSFLVTLSTMSLFTGIAIVVTGGKAVVGFPNSIMIFGNMKIGIFPFSALLFLLLAILLQVVLKNTPYGKKLYMFGVNEKATQYSGVKKTEVIFKTFIIASMLAGIAGLVLMGRTNSAKANYGFSYTLQGILVCLLGGVSWDGGKGKLAGVLISLFILQFISSGLNLFQATSFLRNFFWDFY